MASPEILVRVGVYENWPLVFRDEQGQYSGIYVDLLDHVAAEAGWRLRYVPGTWPESLQRLERGEIDLLVAIGYSEERAQRLDYSSETVLANWGVIYARRGAQLHSYLDLQGKTFAVLHNDIHWDALQPLLEGFGVSYRTVEVSEYAEVFEAVADGRADAGVMNRLVALHLAPGFDSVEHTPMLFNPVELRFAAPKGRNAALLAAVDAHIRNERAEPDSNYHRSLRHWVGGVERSGWPTWATWLLAILGGGGVLAVSAAMTLRVQVRARTADLAATNEILRSEISLRVEAEQALRRSEAGWRSLVENAPDIILLVDREGTILFANRIPAGLEREAEIYTNCVDFVVDEYRIMAREAIADVFATGRVREYEMAARSPTDRPTWYATLLAPVARDGVVEVILVSLRDITDRRQAEEQTRDLALFPTENPSPVLRLADDGTLLYANAAAAPLLQLWGCQPGETLPEVWRAWMAALLAEQTVMQEEVQAGGQTFALTWAPIPDGGYVNVYGMDVTERNRAEAMLAHEQYLMSTLMANVPDYVYYKDSDARFLRISDSMAHALGLQDSAEAVGKTDLDYFPGELAQVFLDSDRILLAEGTPVIDHENRVRWPDGHESWLSTTAVAFGDAQGRPVGTLGISRDVTQRRRLEEQLRQAQRLESIGRLAGGVAHDFNNLLTVIIGSCDFLLESIDEEDPRRSDVESVQRAGRRAAELTRQLLAFGRRQVLEMQVLDLNEVLTGLRRMIERVIREDIHLNLAPAPDLYAVRCDPGQIEQVVMNLVVNACDAMPEGGELTLETQNVVLDESYAEQYAEVVAGDYVMLAVSDTGCGMTPDVLGRMFEPFFTTKEQGRGTGLGLATVYGIVKQSGGHISAYSEPGAGAIFKVYLPRNTAPTTRIESVVAPTELCGGAETVLLIEDDATVRSLAHRMLTSLGYRVLVTAGADEAEAVAENSSEPIHVVFADVVLKDHSGPQAVAVVRRHRPDVRILYMSGYTDSAIVHQGVLDPGIHLLSKPFTMVELARRLREALDGPSVEG
ncbi:MAG: PAS domain-containing protein [Anaerolineae bacterium]